MWINKLDGSVLRIKYIDWGYNYKKQKREVDYFVTIAKDKWSKEEILYKTSSFRDALEFAKEYMNSY